VTFAQKLTEWLQLKGWSRAQLAEAAGLKPTLLTNYVARSSVPQIDNALKIARAMGVSLDWLADPAQGWPPPKLDEAAEDRLHNVSHDNLIRELARRYRLEVLDVRARLEEAANIDWSKTMEEVEKLEPNAPVSPDLARKLRLAQSVAFGAFATAERFDVRLAADLLHEQLPGGNFPRESLDFASALKALANLGDAFAGVFRWSATHVEMMQAQDISIAMSYARMRELLAGVARSAAEIRKTAERPRPK
jgi:transcriptional regulator with XRE-family HTH domain